MSLQQSNRSPRMTSSSAVGVWRRALSSGGKKGPRRPGKGADTSKDWSQIFTGGKGSVRQRKPTGEGRGKPFTASTSQSRQTDPLRNLQSVNPFAQKNQKKKKFEANPANHNARKRRVDPDVVKFFASHMSTDPGPETEGVADTKPAPQQEPQPERVKMREEPVFVERKMPQQGDVFGDEFLDALQPEPVRASSTEKPKRAKNMQDRVRQYLEIAGVDPARKKPIDLPDRASLREAAMTLGVSQFHLTNIFKMLNKFRPAILSRDLLEKLCTLVGIPFNVKKEYIGDIRPRSPVITLLGHVDHGKTSILDRIRGRTTQEAGNITQRVSTFHVPASNGQSLTYFDTPGHEMFWTMRSHVAKVTDIVVIVIAADEGIQDQTREVLLLARGFDVPVIIALNKCDRATAKDKQAVRDGLEELGIDLADTQVVEMSAKTGMGFDDLEEALLLLTDVIELESDYAGPLNGVVIDTEIVKGTGKLHTVLIREGTMQTGKKLRAGGHTGNLKRILMPDGSTVKEAFPSSTVRIRCFKNDIRVGSTLVSSDGVTDLIADEEDEFIFNSKPETQTGSEKEINLILKADLEGAVQTLHDYVRMLPLNDLKVNVVSSSTGMITDTDMRMAILTGAHVYGFNVAPNSAAASLHKDHEEISVKTSPIIYEILDDIVDKYIKELPPQMEESLVGQARVEALFQIRDKELKKDVTVLGCKVLSGSMQKAYNYKIRVLRDGEVVQQRCEIASMMKFKQESRVVQEGDECGIRFKHDFDVHEGDVVECILVTKKNYNSEKLRDMVRKARTESLSSSSPST